MVDHPRRAIFKLAHLLVDNGNEILDPVGNGRVRGEVGAASLALLRDRGLAGVAILEIRALCQGDRFGKDFDLFRDAGPAAEEGVDDFFEIKQPERQLHVARVEHLRFVAEAGAVFIVRINQEDAQTRPRIENTLQDARDTAGFADAGRADDGEMFADQLFDVDVDPDIRVLLQMSDFDPVTLSRAIDHLELSIGENDRGVTDVRII